MGKADVFTGMSLTEKLIWLKKFGNGGSTPTYEDRTATGNPVIFTTNFAQNAKALSVDFTPKQNLNGYSKPWVGGAGENLLPFIACDEGTRNGIRWTKNVDGSIHIKGTATISETMSKTQSVLIADKSFLTYFDPGKYAITSFGGRLLVQFTDEEQSKQTFSGNTILDGQTAYYTFTEKTAIYVRVSVKSADGAVDKDIKVSVVKGETAPTEWTPYENICPITGIDSIDVVANSNTHEFDLGRTVYGGTLDTKNGVLTIDRASVDLGSFTWYRIAANRFNANEIRGSVEAPINASTAVDAKCSSYPVVSFNEVYSLSNSAVSVIGKNSSNVGQLSLKDMRHESPPTATDNWLDGVMFVYKLATPLTYQLTAQQMALLEGENVIVTDGDNLIVIYQVKV